MTEDREPSVYGPVTEHPEVPIEDDWHFSVTIYAHPFRSTDPFEPGRCDRCGFPRRASHHNWPKGA